jgi:hypothetical protein
MKIILLRHIKFKNSIFKPEKNIFKCQKLRFFVGGLNKVHENYEKTVCGNFGLSNFFFTNCTFLFIHNYHITQMAHFLGHPIQGYANLREKLKKKF